MCDTFECSDIEDLPADMTVSLTHDGFDNCLDGISFKVRSTEASPCIWKGCYGPVSCGCGSGQWMVHVAVVCTSEGTPTCTVCVVDLTLGCHCRAETQTICEIWTGLEDTEFSTDDPFYRVFSNMPSVLDDPLPPSSLTLEFTK